MCVDNRCIERRPDTSADAGATCMPSPELCNEHDDDCDGATDEGYDISNDVAHCGRCDVRCDAIDHARGQCIEGECRASCDPGWGDCDGDAATGCEAALGGAEHCGSCELACGPTELCNSGGASPACVSACPTGTTPCGGECASTATDPRHCGSCATACPDPPANATAVCASGSCSFACRSGYVDVDGAATNGCECGPMGAERCNAIDDDCNGMIDDGPTAGCPCNVTELGASVYLVCPPQPWIVAASQCAAYGYHLIAIGDASENMWSGDLIAFLNGLGGSSTPWWIGMNDRAVEGTWVWDGGGAVTFTSWAPGEPNDFNGIEDCGFMPWGTPYQWNDGDCGMALPFACEASRR